MAPPVIILGVGRSGTTLLRVMLDRSSELAIPYETFFVPQLAHRHGRRPNLDRFLDDLGRLRTLYDWGIKPDDVRPRLREAAQLLCARRRRQTPGPPPVAPGWQM